MSLLAKGEEARRFRLMAAASFCAHAFGWASWSFMHRAEQFDGTRPLADEQEIVIEVAEPGPDPGASTGSLEADRAAIEGSSSARPAVAATAAGQAPVGPAVAARDDAAQAEGDAQVLDKEDSANANNALAGNHAVQRGARLSLEQLGVGSSRLFPSPSIDKRGGMPQRKKTVDYSARLSDGMVAMIAQDDQRKGLGPEGPAITHVLASAYAGSVPDNANARLSITADGEGRVVSVQVLTTDGARDQWNQLAQQVLEKLRNQRLRVMGRRGFRFTLQVNSRVQMPSGADPGVSVNAFGVPIAKGRGPRSTSIDVLNPTNPGNVLGVAGDLADIGAVARRIVRAHLESLDVFEDPAAKSR